MEPVELEKHSSTGSDSDSERLHYATVGGAGAPGALQKGLNLMRSRREDAPNSKFESRPSKHVAHTANLTVCLVVGLEGWVGSIPHFGDGADPFLVWFHL